MLTGWLGFCKGGRHGSVDGGFGCGSLLEALDSTDTRADRHDVDLEPAVHVDLVHGSTEPEARYYARRAAMDLLPSHHSPDLVLAIPGLPGRSLRPARPDLDRGPHVGRQLGALGLCRQHLDALSHLRGDRRL